MLSVYEDAYNTFLATFGANSSMKKHEVVFLNDLFGYGQKLRILHISLLAISYLVGYHN